MAASTVEFVAFVFPMLTAFVCVSNVLYFGLFVCVEKGLKDGVALFCLSTPVELGSIKLVGTAPVFPFFPFLTRLLTAVGAFLEATAASLFFVAFVL